MNIRAKMKCHKVDTTLPENVAVTLTAVVDGSEENKSFAKWTPAASVNISISNPAALNAFEEGKEYYVDFSPAA